MFFSKILVTNAPLYIVPDKIRLKDVEKSKKIEEIGDHANYAIMMSSVGPDLIKHTIHRFKSLYSSQIINSSRNIARHNASIGRDYPEYFRGIPKYLQGLATGDYECRMFLAQSFIVNLEGLSDLLNEIKEIVIEAHAKRFLAWNKEDGD